MPKRFFQLDLSAYFYCMVKRFIIICLFLVAASQSAMAATYNFFNKVPIDTAKKYRITGVITQTSSYCGGAAPPEQLLKKLATPAPYPGKKFYIRAGKVNSATGKIIVSFVTDENGLFSLKLAPGIYSMIVEEQLKPIDIKQLEAPQLKADEKCLKDWWAKPFYLLVVKNRDISNLSFNIHHACFVEHDVPCLQYIGPAIP